jgi:hypothetical protein
MQTHPLVDRECSLFCTAAEPAGRKVLVAPPIDRREAGKIWEAGKPVKSGFHPCFLRFFSLT